MDARRDHRQTDRLLGFGGVVLAVVALGSSTQRIEVAGSAEVVPAIMGLLMVLQVLIITVRHRRVHPGGRGRGWLAAGWIVLGFNLVWAVVQAADTAAFAEGFWSGLAELATGPPIVMVLVPLVLCSVAILSDSSDTGSDSARPHAHARTSARVVQQGPGGTPAH